VDTERLHQLTAEFRVISERWQQADWEERFILQEKATQLLDEAQALIARHNDELLLQGWIPPPKIPMP